MKKELVRYGLAAAVSLVAFQAGVRSVSADEPIVATRIDPLGQISTTGEALVTGSLTRAPGYELRWWQRPFVTLAQTHGPFDAFGIQWLSPDGAGDWSAVVTSDRAPFRPGPAHARVFLVYWYRTIGASVWTFRNETIEAATVLLPPSARGGDE